jgi:hypothetical protein
MKSSLEILSKMMQTFTLSYTDSTKLGPAFYILFTNFSRYEKDQDLDECPFWDDDNAPEENKKDPQTKTPAVQKEEDQNLLTFENLVK